MSTGTGGEKKRGESKTSKTRSVKPVECFLAPFLPIPIVNQTIRDNTSKKNIKRKKKKKEKRKQFKALAKQILLSKTI